MDWIGLDFKKWTHAQLCVGVGGSGLCMRSMKFCSVINVCKPVTYHTRLHYQTAKRKTVMPTAVLYLAEDCQLVAVTWRCQLRSSDTDTTSSSANQHTVRWSLVCRCGATNTEQSANPLARLRTITRTIQAVTQDTSLQAYYLVTDSCSAEWQCFSCAGHKLTYLLTYLSALEVCSWLGAIQIRVYLTLPSRDGLHTGVDELD